MSSKSHVPVVTVITPVYNGVDTIRRFVDSVIAQTMSNWELICVDDGSTDETPEILDAYADADKRIKVIRTAHTNAGNARNVGLQKAKGQYICFLDSDDYCKPHMFATLVSAAKAKKADVVICEADYVKDNTGTLYPMTWSIRWHKIKKSTHGTINAEMYPKELFQLFITSPWTKLIHHDLIKRHQIRAQSQLAANDVVLIHSCLAAAKRIYPIHDVLYTQYRNNPTSITKNLYVEEKSLCGYTSALGLKEALIRLGKYDLLRTSFQQFAIHNCMWYLHQCWNDPPLFNRIYNMLRDEGFEKLDLIHVDPFVRKWIVNKDEYTEFEYTSKYTLPEYYRMKMQFNYRQKTELLKELKKIKNSRAYKFGEAMAKPIRVSRNILKKAKKKIRAYNSTLRLKKEMHAYHKQQKKLRSKYEKSIAIVAFESFHFSVTETIIRICNPDKNFITVFTTTRAYKEITAALGEMQAKVQWRTVDTPYTLDKRMKKGTTVDKYRVLAEIAAQENCWDMMILPSPEYHPDWYEAIYKTPDRKFKIIAGVHNLNAIFDTSVRIPKSYNFFCQADAYAVIDRIMMEEMESRSLLEGKDCYVFPPLYTPEDANEAVPEEDVVAAEKNLRTNFVITGLVEPSRKDYQAVVDALAMLEDMHSRIRLVLLGNAGGEYARDIVRQLSEMEKTGLETVSYDGYVPAGDFDRVLKTADYLLAPIVPTTGDEYVTEYYGRTKISGVQQDIVKFAKPALVTDQVPMPRELDSSIVYYSDTESMADAIRDLVRSERKKALLQEARQNSEKFSLEKLIW